MLDVVVIDQPAAAEATLDPLRTRLLAELAAPASASSLAARLGLPRQQINYHLHTLEHHGLLQLVEERRKGNVIERVLRAVATSYVISPLALASLAPDPNRAPDQLSARWLVALAARLIQELGELITRATTAGQSLATFGLDTEVRFASAADRAAFVTELTVAVEQLVARYHDDAAPRGRQHRVIVALHPSITRPDAAAAPLSPPQLATPEPLET